MAAIHTEFPGQLVEVTPVVAGVGEEGGVVVLGSRDTIIGRNQFEIPPASPIHNFHDMAVFPWRIFGEEPGESGCFARRLGQASARSMMEPSCMQAQPEHENGRGITPRPERSIGYKWPRVKGKFSGKFFWHHRSANGQRADLLKRGAEVTSALRRTVKWLCVSS
jgi:hypothetical protein